MEKYVITISRQFASMGRSIAAAMAKELGINFYDRDIVEAAAERMGQHLSTISDAEEKASSFFLRKKDPFSMGTYSISDEIFAVERNIIRDFAAIESCIIVGRCGDSILRDHPRHLSVYVYAPYEARLYNCTHDLMMEEKAAIKAIREVDAARSNYQRKYCPEVHGPFDNKDILIDSSRFGVQGTAKILCDIARKQFGCQ